MFFLDIEASGLHEQSYPIQIGWYDSEKAEGNEYLIKPAAEWTHWSEEAENIHNISRDSLDANGLTATEACQLLNQQFAGRLVYSDAVMMDQFWLERLFQQHNGVQAFELLDVKSLIRKDNRDAFEYDLNELARPHSALADAKLLADFLLLRNLTKLSDTATQQVSKDEKLAHLKYRFDNIDHDNLTDGTEFLRELD